MIHVVVCFQEEGLRNALKESLAEMTEYKETTQGSSKCMS